MAESPPPTTMMFWSLKKNPSHVAHVETPRPMSFVSAGSPRSFAVAPVAMMIVWPSQVASPACTTKGRREKSTAVTSSAILSGPKCSPRPFIVPLRSGPRIPPTNPRQVSPHLLSMSSAPRRTPPSLDRPRVAAVADEERLVAPAVQAARRLVEDLALGLPPADGVGDDDRAEAAGDALALEDVHGGRRVVEVRDDRQPVPPREALEQRPVMEGKLGGLPELGPVGIDQRLAEPGWQPRRVEREATEEVVEPLGGRDLTVVDRAQPLGLAPALDERLVARLEGDLGGVRSQDLVEVARRGAHRPPVHLDLGHAIPIEADQRVEEVEEDSGVGHQSGFRPAYPSSRPCQ